MVSLLRQYNVLCLRCRYISRAAEAELEEIDARKQSFAAAKENRRHREMHLIDEAGLQILTNRRHPAADAHVFAFRGLARSFERFVNSAGDEVKDSAAVHRDRRTRVMREYEHRYVVGRIIAPPAFPTLIGPRP